MDGWEKLVEAATQTTLATMERARRLEEHRRQKQQRDTDLTIEQLRDSVDEFDHAAELAQDVRDGCDLCGEMVNYLRWTSDDAYLVCEVCWSEYQEEPEHDND